MKRLWTLCVVGLVVAVGMVLFGLKRDGLSSEARAISDLQRSAKGASVVIVVLDAMRADHVGCYGYGRDTTPNIDALAQESILFSQHYSEATWTLPSTVALFTGKYPLLHWLIFSKRTDRDMGFTLAGGLQANGFETALFSSNPQASGVHGIDQGFGVSIYHVTPLTEEPKFSPTIPLRDFENWLDSRGRGRFFAYLHLLPPHVPYAPPATDIALFSNEEPPGYAAGDYTPWQFEFPIVEQPILDEPPQMPKWINLYDSNLRYGDWAVGRVIDILRSRQLLEETVLIVTSDHGEAFGEHGFIWHSNGIHDEAVHIPLLIRLPGSRLPARRVDCPTQTIDLLPTICEMTGTEYPADVQGHSLLPVVTGASETAGAYTVSHSLQPAKWMIRDATHALLIYKEPPRRILYDMRTDPDQRQNVIEEQPVEAARLLGFFRAYAQEQQRHSAEAEPQLPAREGLSPEVTREMEALGYLR